jgi:hypothetical protein
MVCIREESQMTLELNDVMAVLIHLLSHSLAHAENAFEHPLDEGIMVPMLREEEAPEKDGVGSNLGFLVAPAWRGGARGESPE